MKMMKLKQLSNELRNVADLMDLFNNMLTENPKAKSVNVFGEDVKIRNKKVKKSKKKIHWTQRPKNRKKVLAIAKKMAKARKA